MNCKEDLIGTGWECPRCKVVEVITKDGIVHSCHNSYINKRLDMIWEDTLNLNKFIEIQKRLISGEVTEEKINEVIEKNKDKIPFITKHSENCYTVNAGTMKNGRSMTMTMNKQGLDEFNKALEKRVKDYGK